MSKKKILVVDDEKLIVKGIRFSLEQDDMEVDCAYDGEEALQYAKNCEYDLVLLDVMLPGIDGFEVCRRIRATNSRIGIIMLTARSEDADKILVMDGGQIVAMGTHDELLKTCDIYRETYESQMKGGSDNEQ